MSTKMRKLEDPGVLERLKESIKNLKHEEIAKQWGLSRSYVGQVLSGRAMMSSTVIRALVLHGYDVHYILLGERKGVSDELIETKEELVRAKDLITSLERILMKR